MARFICAGIACLLGMGIPTTWGPVFSSPEAGEKPSGKTLLFTERVAYQRAVEEVYWRYRVWPKENAQRKPSLDTMISQTQIERNVEAYLRKSRLVAQQRGWPITPSELQAEMDRMASHTKRPEVLRELFATLGNDPFVIAQCLARPIVAERLVAKFSSGAKDASLRAKSRNPAAPLMGNFTGSFGFAQRHAGADVDTAIYKLPEISLPLDCADDTWTATTTVNAPDGRWGHTAVWTGSEMIVWGGSFLDHGYHFFNTGGRYDPATDTWTPTSTINAPIARWLHTAVWTGSQMIVWGGGDNTDFLDTGGRYNPMTDTWTPTSTTNAPTERVNHTAIWTGSEMVVWGGYNYTQGNFNTGGRYDPVIDSWAATSTTNVPEARWDHTAEWTGSEMIIWGGTNNTTYLNTGGRYDPKTDSWAATGVPNNVLGRVGHTSIWSGSEMMVWAGTDSTFNDCNTGGRYNPIADTWTATSMVNAPSPRDSLAAVWTGSEMIVWGGVFCCPGIDFNTGGRYNAGTNTWTPTSTANAPLERWDHTAVWTGSEMIVWGGYNSELGVFLNTGGRYCAESGPTPTATPTATATATATSTPTATPTPRVTPTPRIAPTPRSRPTPAPRP
jgi:N-acetylneuraminic acid mutarotase